MGNWAHDIMGLDSTKKEVGLEGISGIAENTDAFLKTTENTDAKITV